METAGLLLTVLLALGAGVPATSVSSDGLERHSGTIVTIDRVRDVIVLEEIRAWDAPLERPQLTRYRVYVTGVTEFKLFTRRTVPGGYRGDFAEMPLEVTALSRGDTVTAECVRAGDMLAAMSVVVTNTP